MANIESNIDAKEYLMRIFQKLDDTRHYGSMTHSFYALETMQLALDDTYGTNSLVLQQYKFANPNAKKPNNKKKTKAQKLKALKQDEEDELLF